MSSRVAVLLALVILAVYANGLGIGFRFDDGHALSENPAIRTLANLPRFFVDPTTSSTLPENRDLRPVLLATFALNYALSGEATWSWHALNLVLHWVAVLLVFRIVRDHLWLGADALTIAAGAALVVAVHPLNTEPIDYLSARSALLTAVFYLGAFDAGVRGRRALRVALFGLAMLTKALACTLPAALLGHALLDRRRAGVHLRGAVVRRGARRRVDDLPARRARERAPAVSRDARPRHGGQPRVVAARRVRRAPEPRRACSRARRRPGRGDRRAGLGDRCTQHHLAGRLHALARRDREGAAKP